MPFSQCESMIKVNKALFSFLDTTSDEVDISSLLIQILQIVKNSIPCERCAVFSFCVDSMSFSHLDTRGILPPEQILHTIAQLQKYVLPDGDGKSILDPVLFLPQHLPFQSNAVFFQTVLLPIACHQRLYGIYGFYYPLSGNGEMSFPEEDLQLLEQIRQLSCLACDRIYWMQEATLSKEREDAWREMNEWKDKFLKITSHEFRTPITVILSNIRFIERLLKRIVMSTENSERLRENIFMISEQGRLLSDTVATYLDLTRENQGKIVMRFTVVEVEALIKRIVKNQLMISSAHPIHLTFALADIPYLALADEFRLMQAITNVITNAAKYSPMGGAVYIEVAQKLREDFGKSIEIRIADSGIGVPLEARAHLFEENYRALNAKDSEIAGSGLGLYLVAELLELQNSVMYSEDTNAHSIGASFVVVLPLYREEESISTQGLHN